MEIAYRHRTDKKPAKIFRTLHDDMGCTEWARGMYSTMKYNCHWGQRKLLFSEIEFFSVISKYIKLSDFLVVYVGSASGIHIPLLKQLFPEISFLLYDPLPYVFSKLEDTIIKTGEEGWFGDDKLKEVLEIAKGKKIIFISDIRVTPEEKTIREDMINQQRWAIKLDSEFMLLKFRLPYTVIENIGVSFEYNIDEIKDKVIIDKNNIPEENLLYLDGHVYIQIYPPKFSTETRLLAKKIKYCKNKDKYSEKEQEMYLMKYHDYHKYECQMSHFNRFTRSEPFIFRESNDVPNHLLGYDNGYDSVSEYYILYKYYKHYKKDRSDYHKKIINLSNLININLMQITNRNLVVCHIQNIFRFMREHITSHARDKYKIKSALERMIAFLDQTDELIERIKSTYTKQYRLVNKSNILSRKKIKKQIKATNKMCNSKRGIARICKDRIIVNPEFYEKRTELRKLLVEIWDSFKEDTTYTSKS